MPDREQRFLAMLDTVEAVTSGRPRVLDLAGGPGSISRRLLRRWPQAQVTVVDLDPVLLAIARAGLPAHATVVSADLNRPQWSDSLPHHDYDAVLTATALHWLMPDRVADLYREIRQVLRPGGVFINADHITDDGLPGLSRQLDARARARREARYAAGAVLSWQAWWQHVATDPVLGPLAAQRAELLALEHRSSEVFPPLSWHLASLQAAGYAETGLIWRGGTDAAVAAVR